MANPFEGFMFDEQYYRYDTGSYSKSRALLNRTDITQERRRAISTLGIAPATHSVALLLENTYSVLNPADNNIVGSTTWLGLSRLYDLEQKLNYMGNSLPFTIVTPAGTTHLVVVTGMEDATMFITSPQSLGVEWRVPLTFEEIS